MSNQNIEGEVIGVIQLDPELKSQLVDEFGKDLFKCKTDLEKKKTIAKHYKKLIDVRLEEFDKEMKKAIDLACANVKDATEEEIQEQKNRIFDLHKTQYIKEVIQEIVDYVNKLEKEIKEEEIEINEFVVTEKEAFDIIRTVMSGKTYKSDTLVCSEGERKPNNCSCWKVQTALGNCKESKVYTSLGDTQEKKIELN